MMTMLALAIVFFMTVKVSTIGSIVAIVIAVVLGLMAASILLNQASTKASISNKKTNSIN